MSDFEPTNERLVRIAGRIDGFPLDQMRAARMTYLLHKKLREKTNVVLKQYDLTDTSHSVLAILYGSPDEASTASRLGVACGEKPANLTRICDDLAARGLIARHPQPNDRRGVVITLSDQGRALIRVILPQVGDAIAGAYAGFDRDELQLLLAMQVRALASLDHPE